MFGGHEQLQLGREIKVGLVVWRAGQQDALLPFFLMYS